MSSYDFLVACAEVHVRETVSTIKESLIGISSPTCLGLIMWTQEGKDIYNSYTIRTLLQDLLYRYVSSSLLLPSVTSSVVMLFMHLESSHPRTNIINLASRTCFVINRPTCHSHCLCFGPILFLPFKETPITPITAVSFLFSQLTIPLCSSLVQASAPYINNCLVYLSFEMNWHFSITQYTRKVFHLSFARLP